MRVTARAIETAVFPSGARIPVTSLQLAGDRIAFWTIMPLQPGDHVELMARTSDGAQLRAGLVVAQVQIRSAAPAYDAGGRVLNAALAAAMTLPILLARRWPLPVALGVLAAVTLDQVLGGDGGYQWFVVVLVVYALGAHAGALAGPVGAGVVAVLLLAVDIPRLREGAPVDEVLPGWAVLVGVYGLGRWLRHRRREVARLSDRAAELERDQETAARRAVDLERARIALELHDLCRPQHVGHRAAGPGRPQGGRQRPGGHGRGAGGDRVDRARRDGRAAPAARRPPPR